MLTSTSVRLIMATLKHPNQHQQRYINLFDRLLTSNAEHASEVPKPEAQVGLENELKQLREKQKKTDEEIADVKDKYMRALAEAENTRVRMRKQVDDAKVFGIQNFCKDLLEVADILNLAIVNTSTEKFTGEVDATKADDKSKLIGTEFKAMYNGLKLTETKLMKIFEKHGLNRIEPKEGDKFDPNLHEAIFQTPVPNKEPGSICAITQNGYKLQERVIRAAKVGVVQ